MVNRRTLLGLALLPWLAGHARAQTSPGPAVYALAQTPQDRADIARIEAYMNTLKTLKARFLQVSPDGATSGGTAWIDRPGRLRFAYAPPTPLLLVAGHGLVSFHDSQLGQTSNFPLSTTPLGILLSGNLKLSGDVTVTALQRAPGQLQVTLVRTASPGDGSLTLVFADPPLALRQWVVIDAQRQRTTVSLLDVQLGGVFDQGLFDYVDPAILGHGPAQGAPTTGNGG